MNKIDSFNEKAEFLFRPLLEAYGYLLTTTRIKEVNGQPWLVHHIYENSKARRRVILKQEPYYTDYGFSVFIHKSGTEEFNILCNIPHEKQDKEDKFIEKACKDIFSNNELIELIAGKSWKKLGFIPIRW